MRTTWIGAGVLAAMALSGATATTPQFHSPSPAASSYSIRTKIYGDPDFTAASGSGTGSHTVSSGGSNAKAAVAYSPVPYVATSVNNPSQSGASFAEASLTYEYVFVANDDAAASTLADYLAQHGGVGASIRGHIDLVNGPLYGKALGTIDAGAGTTEFDCGAYYYGASSSCVDHPVTVPGTLTRLGNTLSFNGFITLDAKSYLYEGGSLNPLGGDAYKAYVDPIIGLADGLDPSVYTLSLSNGVANTSGGSSPFGGGGGGGLLPPPIGGIPEPASWMLLIVGFGVVGGMARCRRIVAA